MSRFIDLTGQTFGRLTVVRRVANPKGQNARWHCKCDCGSEASVISISLRTGKTRSCGCFQIESARRSGLANATHGHSVNGVCSRTYRSWESMKARCTNQNHHAWDRYGGRGIEVCDRWLESFENFLADMGERPPNTSLDRYPDNNGNYEPGNCRWATRKEQNWNRRTPKAAIQKQCEVCSCKYTAKLRKSRFCSRKCKQAAYMHRKRSGETA